MQYLTCAKDKGSQPTVLKGRSAASKNGTRIGVPGAMSPPGCSVTSFEVLSKERSQR